MAVYGENTENALPQHGLFREHTAAAFNSEIGKPRWGFGLYLFDVPAAQRAQDPRQPRQADPECGRSSSTSRRSRRAWSARSRPRSARPTPTANGTWGPRPIDKIHVVGTNGIMLIEIQAYGQWEFHTLVITEMNIAYWRGDRDRHVYAMQTGIAPPGSPPAPTNLALEPLERPRRRA